MKPYLELLKLRTERADIVRALHDPGDDETLANAARRLRARVGVLEGALREAYAWMTSPLYFQRNWHAAERERDEQAARIDAALAGSPAPAPSETPGSKESWVAEAVRLEKLWRETVDERNDAVDIAEKASAERATAVWALVMCRNAIFRIADGEDMKTEDLRGILDSTKKALYSSPAPAPSDTAALMERLRFIRPAHPSGCGSLNVSQADLFALVDERDAMARKLAEVERERDDERVAYASAERRAEGYLTRAESAESTERRARRELDDCDAARLAAERRLAACVEALKRVRPYCVGQYHEYEDEQSRLVTLYIDKALRAAEAPTEGRTFEHRDATCSNGARADVCRRCGAFLTGAEVAHQFCSTVCAMRGAAEAPTISDAGGGEQGTKAAPQLEAAPAPAEEASPREQEPAPTRDESVPPPGYTGYMLAGGNWVANCTAGVFATREGAIAAMWAHYDREHGDAPAAPDLSRFRALADRWSQPGCYASERACARELLALVEELSHGG